MRVIGTAGHVDHGKSTLVKALTGINPDRLKEEQAREMTIDLGFAWMTLPSGQTVSLVDVPGHEAFIKNMLAGVGGIDAALLVIAADEGIMPQTREHLAILDLLQIKGGIVALTKTDLALEAGWLDLITDEVRAALKDTALATAPIIPVSAKTRRGLDELTRELDRVLAEVAEKSERGRARLPVDRVFSIAGFGTVVTGTLSDGSFAVGDEVEIIANAALRGAPRAIRARVRGVQTHKEKMTRAAPGGRVALNLAGVTTEEIERGDTVIQPDTYTPTLLIDARIRWLDSAPKALRHNEELDLFVFASEVSARVRLLEGEKLAQGASALAQLVLKKPVVVAKGDRFILRYPSPSLTVGGGAVIEPHPRARHRRGRAQVIEQLTRAERGTPSELVAQVAEARGAVTANDVAKELGLDVITVTQATTELIGTGELISLDQDHAWLYMSRGGWARWRQQAVELLEAYHRQFPLRRGMPREEFKSRMPKNLAYVSDAAILRAESEGILRADEKSVWLPTHEVRFDPALQTRMDELLAAFERAPFSPPSFAEAQSAVGSEALNLLIEQGRLEKISSQVLLTPDAVKSMTDWVIQKIRERGEVTGGELRDQFDTSRKYAIAFLEYLDQRRITRRVGDARVLR